MKTSRTIKLTDAADALGISPESLIHYHRLGLIQLIEVATGRYVLPIAEMRALLRGER